MEFKTSLREMLTPVRQDMEAKDLTEIDVENEIKTYRMENKKTS